MLDFRFVLAAIFVLLTDWARAEDSKKRVDEQEDAVRAIRRPGISIQATSWTGRPYIHIDNDRAYKALTEQEAALPNVTTVAASPDVTEGPLIEVSSPDSGATYDDGFPVDIRFRIGPSGLGVNADSLKVVYKKMWG